MVANAAEAHQIISDSSIADAKRYFGPYEGQPLGAGLIYKSVRHPIYIPDQQLFGTIAGYVYVVTHECDIDPENGRVLSGDVLVCPILPLEKFYTQIVAELPFDKRKAFLSALGGRSVHRLMYLPTVSNDLPLGGVLNLNTLTSVNTDCFQIDGAKTIACLSAYGLQQFDWVFQNHLFRPKSSTLPLTRH